MNRKIKMFISLLTCIVICFSLAVPAFAEDSSSDTSSGIVGSIIYKSIAYNLKQDACYVNGLYSDDYYCMLVQYSGSNDYYIYLVSKNITFDDNFPCFNSLGKFIFSFSSITYYTAGFRLNNDNSYDCINHNKFTQNFANFKYEELLYSDFAVYDSDGNRIDFNSILTPFTVTTSPALDTDMSRTGTLVAPGSSNDGTTIETNSLAVTVTLTDEFIELRNSDEELQDYTYEFICYITTSPPESTSYSDSLNNAVYTYLHYGDYMYTTSGVVADVTDDYNEPTNWIKATGVNAGNIIPKGSKSKTITINLENLDSSEFDENTQLYLVVYGRLTAMNTPTPDYFDLANQGYLCNNGSLNSRIIITIDADYETGEGTDIEMPDYYCSTSSAFNYIDYPEYTPISINGNDYDTNKPVTDYLDKNIPPDTLRDYDMDVNGEQGLSPDEFEEYIRNKELAENYASFNFDATSLDDIFTQSGSFFKFLTACISILPSYFLTILISFFTVLLAIVVIKLVV